MRIGIPKEIKDKEFRVGATPPSVRGFVDHGHEVFVQSGAGLRIGFTDEAYEKAGAKIVSSAKEVWKADMIIKVKEPLDDEFSYMHPGQILFTYLHLAADRDLTQKLLDKQIIGVAYETVVDAQGRLPLLTPMSEVAGRLAVLEGARALTMIHGGRGTLVPGIPGVNPAHVLIIGGGVVGANAAKMAMGLGANVTILDRNMNRLRELDDLYFGRLKTIFSAPQLLEKLIGYADLVICAALLPGKKAPKLITENMVKTMEPGSVIVDVSIDQGGCAETSRPTTHSNPTYIVHDVVHYCVANMPAATARSSTQGLTNVTYPYAIRLANEGVKKVLSEDPLFRQGLNLCMGKVTNRAVADDHGYEYIDPMAALAHVK
ncbi:MAG: alanine dehydrogenase [Chlamydiae bacterium]|nr:alanine dehydrogenase [Chlamydiota bacterium]